MTDIDRPTYAARESWDIRKTVHLRPFALEIQAQMAKAFGPDIDTVDDEKLRGVIRLLAPIAASRDFRSGEKGWVPECWQILFWIKDSKRRPSWPELESKIREAFGLPEPSEPLPGAEVAARRVVSAPADYAAPKALEAAPGDEGDGLPPWIDEFRAVSKDGGGAFDQILLRPLLHLPDHEARKAIGIIRAENERHEREKRERNRASVKSDAQGERHRDRLAAVCAGLRKAARSAAEEGGNDWND